MIPQTLGPVRPGITEIGWSDAALGKGVLDLIIAAGLVMLIAALMLISGGQHGPGRHLSSSVWTGSIRYVSLPPSSVGGRP